MSKINIHNKTVLVTGAAGFIGSALIRELYLHMPGISIIGVDNLNPYYNVNLKKSRLAHLTETFPFLFIEADIADKDKMMGIFKKYRPQIVVNLAAQAGVRYSVTNPEAYIQSNIIGFFNILECCRYSGANGQGDGVEHLLYASSSSVYGRNSRVPFSVQDQTDSPASLYAATKKSNELMAYSYSSLYGIAATGLRFFTVYGPGGRPDMAYFSFADKMTAGEKIQLYNYGDMYRDFTYIDDVVKALIEVMQNIPSSDPTGVKHKVYNIGNHRPESLLHFVEVLEKHLLEAGLLSCPVQKEMLPMQLGDVYQTYADITDLKNDIGFFPSTDLDMGIEYFVKWYKKDWHPIER